MLCAMQVGTTKEKKKRMHEAAVTCTVIHKHNQLKLEIAHGHSVRVSNQSIRACLVCNLHTNFYNCQLLLLFCCF